MHLTGKPLDRTCPCEGIEGIFHAEDMVAFRIESVRVDVYLVARVIAEDEVTFPTVVARQVFVAARFEQGADLGNVFVLDGDVEVRVGTRLVAEQRVHAPAAVYDDLDVVLIEEAEEHEDFVRGHVGAIG